MMFTLDLLKQPTDYYTPVCNWGTHPTYGCGTLLFYEYPFLNERLITYREDLLERVTTYSIGELLLEDDPDDSKRWIMGQIQRKRGLTKRFQNQGLPVWIDLTLREDCEKFMLYAVPDGWKCYTLRKPLAKDLLRKADLAERKAGSDIRLIVYGGSEVVKNICYERKWHYQPEYELPRPTLPAKNNPLRRGLLTPPTYPVGTPHLITILQ